MKRLFAFALYLLISSMLLAETITIAMGSIGYSSRAFDLELGRDTLFMRAEDLYLGILDSKGLFATLNDPHARSSFSPEVSNSGGSGLYGAVYRIGCLSFYSTVSKRYLIGLSYEADNLGSFINYVARESGNEIDQSPFIDHMMQDSIYFGIYYNISKYRLKYILCASNFTDVDNFVSLSYKGLRASVSLNLGDIKPISLKRERKILSLSSHWYEGQLSIDMELAFFDGYLHESARAYELEISEKLMISELELLSRLSIKRGGLDSCSVERTWRLAYRSLRLSYATESGVSIALNKGPFSLEISENGVKAALDFDFKRGNVTLESHMKSPAIFNLVIVIDDI